MAIQLDLATDHSWRRVEASDPQFMAENDHRRCRGCVVAIEEEATDQRLYSAGCKELPRYPRCLHSGGRASDLYLRRTHREGPSRRLLVSGTRLTTDERHDGSGH